ncbi:MAG: amidohydrolase family protein, partial [Actinomycetota bacterium]
PDLATEVVARLVFQRHLAPDEGVLESGGGWIGYWLDRIDAVYGHTFIGGKVPLEHKPSDYFRRQIWISCDPDERTIPALAERYGADRFLWASDFPHADHTPDYVADLQELVDAFPDQTRQAFVGDNARMLFDIAPEAVVGAP